MEEQLQIPLCLFATRVLTKFELNDGTDHLEVQLLYILLRLQVLIIPSH